MSEIIRVRCGGCDVKIKAPLKYQGRRVKCPQCGQQIEIPVLNAAAAATVAPQPASTSKAVAPMLLGPDEPLRPSRPAAASTVRVKQETATTLGDDAFLDRKPAAKKRPDDDFANVDFAEYEDYGPVEDYGAPPKRKAKPRNDDTSKPVRKKKRKKAKASGGGGGFYIDPAIFGGLALMLLGGGIFIWLWNRDIIWPWAGVICIAGLIGMIKGLLGIDDD